MTIDISKKLFILLTAIVVLFAIGFAYWIYENTKSTQYEFELIYLKEADIKYMKADNISCFAESVINNTKMYSCIITRRVK